MNITYDIMANWADQLALPGLLEKRDKAEKKMAAIWDQSGWQATRKKNALIDYISYLNGQIHESQAFVDGITMANLI